MIPAVLLQIAAEAQAIASRLANNKVIGQDFDIGSLVTIRQVPMPCPCYLPLLLTYHVITSMACMLWQWNYNCAHWKQTLEPGMLTLNPHVNSETLSADDQIVMLGACAMS